MTQDERFQHHYDEMVAWASGTKSHINEMLTVGEDRAAALACAMADAAEVAKHAAVVMALGGTS